MNLSLSARLASHRHALPPGVGAPEGPRDPALAQVESLMRQLVLADGVDHLSHMALSQLGAGGRRVRARLALSAADAFGVPKSHAIAWAASVELLHNATLIHDDIQDGDRVRRGKPTVWAQHGVAQAINAGDFLLMLPYVALRGIPALHQGQLAVLLGETSTRVVRGQTCELDLLESGRVDAESYYSAARGKTGALFELPVAGAAILGEVDAKGVAECASLFGRLGLAFQLQDDILDIYGNKGKVQPGADVREGKVTAIIVELLNCRPEMTEEVIRILRKESAMTSHADVARIASLARESGALGCVLMSMQKLLSDVEASSLCKENFGIKDLVQNLIAMILEPLSQLDLEETSALAGEPLSPAS